MNTVENTYFISLKNILLATQTKVLDSIGSLKNEFKNECTNTGKNRAQMLN